MSRFLDTEYNNKLIVDYQFHWYIKEYLSVRIPLILSFNWNAFFKYGKSTNDFADPLWGHYDLHYVAARGFNSRGVNVCDSHWKHYKYRLAKYKDGYYNIPWDDLGVIMGTNSSILIPEDYGGKI